MKLRYISLDLEREEYSNPYGYDFFLHSRYISNYLSKEIRKYKFATDGTFKMISIDGSHHNCPPQIVPLDVLKVTVPFDKERYERVRGTNNCDYYLELFETGFKKASEFKKVPLDTLLKLIGDFKKGGCKNEWLHKKKGFKDYDLEVATKCEFTTNCFQLIIVVNQMSLKKELVSGPIITTEPNEVLYEKMFKDIYVTKDTIVVTDAADTPRVIIDKAGIYKGQLKFEITGDKRVAEMLSYKYD